MGHTTQDATSTDITRRHRTRPRTAAALLAWALLVASAVCIAAPERAEAQDTGSRAAPEDDAPGQGVVSAEVGFGQVDEDFFVITQATVGLELRAPGLLCDGWFPDLEDAASAPARDCETPLRAALGVTLRWRVIDRGAEDPEPIRTEDWDEASEYVRVLRFVEYGSRQAPLYGRLGELSTIVLGNGSIMNGYFNTIDVDHYEVGIHTVATSRYGNLALVLDNITAPEVIGGRLGVQPLKLIDPSMWIAGLELGATWVMDIRAPVTFRRVDAGEDLSQPFIVTDTRNRVARERVVSGVLGGDVGLRLVNTEELRFDAYTDVNMHMDTEGVGVHGGVKMEVRATKDLAFFPKLEVRWMGSRYYPDYFGALYEVERDAFFGFGESGATKLAALRRRDEGLVIGGYGEVTGVLWEQAELTLSLADHEGPKNTQTTARFKAWFDVGEGPDAPMWVGAYYKRIGYDGLDDLLEPSNALVVTEVRYPFLRYMHAMAQYNRLWRLQEEGSYGVVNDWQVGIGASGGF